MRTYFAGAQIGDTMRLERSTRNARNPINPRVEALLREIRQSGSLRKAARALGLAPGNAHRLLRSAESRLGLKLHTGSRGGPSGGGSRLTTAGQSLARRPGDPVAARVMWWPCRALGSPLRGRPLRVFVPDAEVSAIVAPISQRNRTPRYRPGAQLELGIMPEAVTILPKEERVFGSARNVWPARVVAVRKPTRYGVQFVDVEVGIKPLTVAVTASAVSQLRLGQGSRVNLQLKATALRLRERTR